MTRCALFVCPAILGCGCAPDTSYLKFRFIVEPGFDGGDVRIIEDPELVFDENRVYDLYVKDGAVLVPNGFLTRKPVTVEVVEIVDTSGEVVSRGDVPLPGKLSVLGRGARSDSEGRSWEFFSFGYGAP